MPADPLLLERANWWFTRSWYGILCSGLLAAFAACATVAFSYVQFWSSGIRDQQADLRTSGLELQTAEAERAAAEARERAAVLENSTERLKKDNAALERMISPRRWLGGQRGWKVADSLFDVSIKRSSLQNFGGTKALIQFVPDQEAGMLAHDVVSGLTELGWQAEVANNDITGIPPDAVPNGVTVWSLPLSAENQQHDRQAKNTWHAAELLASSMMDENITDSSDSNRIHRVGDASYADIRGRLSLDTILVLIGPKLTHLDLWQDRAEKAPTKK